MDTTKQMGVYSLFENMSQVFGSFIFGIIYVNGVTVGLTIAGGVILPQLYFSSSLVRK